jgi:RNA polymerase sigma-54 factor
MIGQNLIDLINEAGYFNGDLALVAERAGSRGHAVRAILQGFDPPGVCARNPTECLAIQLKERNRFRSRDSDSRCSS